MEYQREIVDILEIWRIASLIWEFHYQRYCSSSRCNTFDVIKNMSGYLARGPWLSAIAEKASVKRITRRFDCFKTVSIRVLLPIDFTFLPYTLYPDSILRSIVNFFLFLGINGSKVKNFIVRMLYFHVNLKIINPIVLELYVIISNYSKVFRA